MTPLNYLLQWRIAVAKNMLSREQMSVAETSLAVAYQTPNGFSTAVSRETGPQRNSLGLIEEKH